MKVLFDDSKKILGVFSDEAVGLEGAYNISLPSPLKTKLAKTVASVAVPYTRKIGLLDSPSEWTVEDVLNAKYQEMAGNYDFWYNEFLDTAAINLDNSKVSTGVFGISIPQGGVVEFVPLKLTKAVNIIKLYVEADAATIVKASADGGEFVEATPNFFFSKATDNIVLRIENPEDSGADVPVHALAIFY